jgi:hypothetical protein
MPEVIDNRVSPPKAKDQLDTSRLATGHQLELMGGDVNLASFTLQMRNKAGIKLVECITDATVDRTVDGASTLTVTIDDKDKQVLKSGKLGRKVDVNVDGLWFTLVSVKKSGRQLTLTFEEREVNVLRYYAKFIMASRDDVTRAEFVLRMIKEVKEIPMKWVIPELHVKQKISDAQQSDEVFVTPAGDPLPTQDDQITTNTARGQQIGIFEAAAKGLTVKGAPNPDSEKIKNANDLMRAGTDLSVSRKVLVCGMMTAIQESSLHNYKLGEAFDGSDSVGVFQQRASQGWPATRNVYVDATEFFKRAKVLDKQQPNISYNDLCQGIQHSGAPTLYGQWKNEADAWVTAYGIASASQQQENAASGTKVDPTNNQATDPSQDGASANSTVAGDGATGASAALNGQYYTRGTLTLKGSSYILTKENSWDCMKRLASDVQWRVFCVSGTIYFISEKWLFKSKPFMAISEETPGVQNIDFDYDEGKKAATVTVSCHMGRWSAPPGSTVRIFGMGPILDGKWLVNDVSRSLYQADGTITLKKPLAVLPESSNLTQIPAGFIGPPSVPGNRNSLPTQTANTVQERVIQYARAQIGTPYSWGGGTATGPSLGSGRGAGTVGFDCSGLTMAAYHTVGVDLPHFAQTQYEIGPVVTDQLQPADLVFFGTRTNLHHVGIYIGGGAMIDAPNTGAKVRVDDNFQTNWSDYFGATRPWKNGHL